MYSIYIVFPNMISQQLPVSVFKGSHKMIKHIKLWFLLIAGNSSQVKFGLLSETVVWNVISLGSHRAVEKHI